MIYQFGVIPDNGGAAYQNYTARNIFSGAIVKPIDGVITIDSTEFNDEWELSGFGFKTFSIFPSAWQSDNTGNPIYLFAKPAFNLSLAIVGVSLLLFYFVKKKIKK